MHRKGLKIIIVFITLMILFPIIKYLSHYNPSIKSNKKASSILPKSSSKENNNKELFFNEPKNKPSSTHIKIYKEERLLELYGDNTLLGRFKIGLGRSPVGTKNKEGDNKTPEGKYYICTKNDKTKYTYFMGISYPNIEDAKRGLNNNLIDNNINEQIKTAIDKKGLPPWNTPLGGAVGIHGGGAKYDWTYGCIAVSDEDIKILWKYCNIGTPVEIFKKCS
ncbi:L,D-transpeptidase catalytic domain [Clostridium liquoris]|uniref:L,D-transpeptidase catalytic domain n=1 Tax=Clostridium liquoris TaxID=1289519 RepID=A0A2T0B8C5_9CLOT|nr:L,D-transpeptidase [Clostridium liquoris]PRR80141.1 L,D-transpeptidase catalytic domain [Clostridium liquoris]